MTYCNAALDCGAIFIQVEKVIFKESVSRICPQSTFSGLIKGTHSNNLKKNNNYVLIFKACFVTFLSKSRSYLPSEISITFLKENFCLLQAGTCFLVPESTADNTSPSQGSTYYRQVWSAGNPGKSQGSAYYRQVWSAYSTGKS